MSASMQLQTLIRMKNFKQTPQKASTMTQDKFLEKIETALDEFEASKNNSVVVSCVVTIEGHSFAWNGESLVEASA